MLVTTTDTYSGRYIELGMVSAVVAAGRFLSMKSMDKQLEAQVEAAQQELMQRAQQLGATAVIGLRLNWMNNNIVATGTAIKRA